MRVFGIAGLCAAMVFAGASVQADLSSELGRTTKLRAGTSEIMPPSDYRGQWWTHPNGCEYSRTGRPGETVWYLIINTAHRGCVPYIKQVAFY